MPDEDRRTADEAFKFKIVEQNAKIESAVNEIKENNRNHEIRLINIESALWGYPKSDSAGLLEKHRSMLKTWSIIIGVISFTAAAVGRLISPLYDKFVTDWAYNSPSEKWMRETSRPKVKIYRIINKDKSDNGEAH